MMIKVRPVIGLLIFMYGFITSFQQKNDVEERVSATVTITFKNVVKNYKMALHDSVYTNSFGENYTINKFRYYVSHISLRGEKTNFIEKDNFYLIDEAEPESQSFSISIPAGHYSSVHFLLGVDSLHNVSGAQTGALDPTKDMFWTWNTGYVMAKLEGKSPASTLVNNKYEFHVGGFAGKYNVLKNISLNFPENKPVHFQAGKVAEIIISADADAWWQGPNDIKIAERANIMTPGKFALAISNNYANMFHLEKIVMNP